ncbi:MAG TPA: hypothetical protein P5513_08220 [Candidatus Diapherotrites archaeon]|nr:hypothetical protein [Candidatus Diapherotrites archaeon]
MKHKNKYEFIYQGDTYNKFLKKELDDYKFNGLIGFTYSPNFLFNLDGGKTKMFSIKTIKLGRYFSLQDFFNGNEDASYIIFYVNPEFPDTIFHPGYKIKVAIIK